MYSLMTFDKRFLKTCDWTPEILILIPLGESWLFMICFLITQGFYCEARMERHWARGSLVPTW